MENKNIRKFNTEKMVGIAIFAALAFVVSLVVRFPVQFLTFDAKDAVITIAAFVYGPVSAVIISFLAALIEMITISTTGWYGFLMNFASSAAFSLTASLIYKKKRNLNGAIISLYSAIGATVGVMLLLNLLVTPLQKPIPAEEYQQNQEDFQDCYYQYYKLCKGGLEVRLPPFSFQVHSA